MQNGGPDPECPKAALDVLAKIAAVVPEELRPVLDDPVVGTPPVVRQEQGSVDMARLREWSRTGRKLGLRYVDEAGARSDRVVWPFMVGDVAGVRALIAWCERRGDFRVFRIDGIDAVEFLTSFSPTSAGVLRRRWLAQEHQRKAVRAADAPDTRDAKWEI